MFKILKGLTLVMVFYVMFQLTGLRSSPVRGEFMRYIMCGVFLFLTHITAVGAVAGNPTSVMMLHPPMNTLIAIWAAAMTTLYKNS